MALRTSERIRIAGDEVISAYDGEPDHPSLRDGWFYPGDVGRIRDDGMVFVLGRSDNVLNMGGVKASALDLERQILEVPGVSDVAVVGLRTLGFGNAHSGSGSYRAVGGVEDVRAGIARRLGQHIRVVPLHAPQRHGQGRSGRFGGRADCCRSGRLVYLLHFSEASRSPSNGRVLPCLAIQNRPMSDQANLRLTGGAHYIRRTSLKRWQHIRLHMARSSCRNQKGI